MVSKMDEINIVERKIEAQILVSISFVIFINIQILIHYQNYVHYFH